MFKKNQNHLQPALFSPENQMGKTFKSVLQGHWSGMFYEKVFKPLDEGLFSPLYCEDNGRPNFPVNILACLEVLKDLLTLTDEQLYENYLFNYTFHRAVGIENIEEYVFDLRTLYNFRSRVEEYETRTNTSLYEEIFKDGRDRIVEELALKTGLQRTDSVMIAANIKRMNRLMLFHKVFSNLVNDILKQKITLSEAYTGLVKEDEDSLSYRLPREKVSGKIQELAERMLQLILDYKKSEIISEMKSYKDAVRLLEEQCRIGGGRVTIKDPTDIDSSSMQNPSDPDATYRRKNDEDHRGYTVHAVETCDRDNPVQVITEVRTVKNNIDDAAVLSAELPALKRETDVETMITDGGFVSDEVRDTFDEHKVVLVTTAIRGKGLSPDALTSVAFPRDEMGLIAACPAGNVPTTRRRDKNGVVSASFDVRKCNICDYKQRCMAYRSEHLSRIVVDRHRAWLDERHAFMKSGEYKDLCLMRPPVEGLMEKMKPKYLRGRVLFRGMGRVRNRMILRAIGLNFRRYMAWILFSFLEIACLIENRYQLSKLEAFAV